MRSHIDNLLSQLFPVECQFCYKLGGYVCSKCEAIFFDSHNDPWVGFVYNRALEHLIHLAKHEGFGQIAYFLGKLWGKSILNTENNQLTSHLVDYQNTIVVPVPLSAQKLRQRGFNQVNLLLLGMYSALKLNLKPRPIVNILLRTRNTATQIGMNREQRLVNLHSVFVVDDMLLQKQPDLINKKVILVDDVCTTGTTLAECKQTLLASQFKNIETLVFARV